jgi:glycosyltransferase involved in cell wall biosynthesis
MKDMAVYRSVKPMVGQKAKGRGATQIESLIENSPYFDHAFYLAQGGQGGKTIDAVREYLMRGEAAGLKPSNGFDPAFYLTLNDDVVTSGRGALAHFVEHGLAERRYPTRAKLRADVERIVQNDLFDTDYYSRYWDDRGAELGLTSIEHYLVFGGLSGARPNPRFDSLFYRGVYRDVQATRENPLIHYIRIGRRERRFINEAELAEARHWVVKAFDAPFYLSQRPDLTEEDLEDLPRHYLLTGARIGLDPAPDFSTEYYTNLTPDLGRVGADGYSHFVKYGRDEGRVGRPDFRSLLRPGSVEHDPSKPTLLIANHEGSRTGAPLVGLALARELCSSHNVITYLGRDAGLVDSFGEVSTVLVVGGLSPLDAEFLLRDLKRRYGLSALIGNSAETFIIVQAAVQIDLPSIALVHEFAETSVPHGKVAGIIAAADRAILPARLVIESAKRELRAHYGAEASNIVCKPQGYLMPHGRRAESDLKTEDILQTLRPAGASKPRIVLGAGFIQVRKGVDLFIQTALEVKRRSEEDVCFVWVGDGYQPDHDITVSVWLREMIEHSGLADCVFLFPAQSGLEAFFDIADVFYLSSRLDPYPNVGVDAIQLGKPLICFRDATGLAEPIEAGLVRGAAVDYCDPTAAAVAIIAELNKDAPAVDPNVAFASQMGDFGDYARFILAELAEARRLRALAIEIRDRIEASDAFDAAYYEGVRESVSPLRSLKSYVSQAVKGLAAANPKPGFSEGLWRSRNKFEHGAVYAPLDQAAHASTRPPSTHQCTALTGIRGGDVPEGGVALHIHMHYPELAPTFMDRLKKVRVPVDLFITTTSHSKRIQIEAAMLEYRSGKVEIFEGPNRGRDIGPFMTSIGRAVLDQGYGLVGHLHAKKSAAAGELVGDLSIGDRWRSYLLDTLLGKPDELAQIMDLFAQDPKLGLVFAEDRHSISWSDNFQWAQVIAQRLEPVPVLPEFPVFPLGNMFWARPAAVASLWKAGLDWKDYPLEPAPGDGTILHAVERMLPAICEAAGYSWSTVIKCGSGW